MKKIALKFSCGHVLAEGERVRILKKMDPILGAAAIVQREDRVDFVTVGPGGSPVVTETLDSKKSAETIKNWNAVYLR